MLEFIPPLLLALTGIGLGWSAFQNYRQSETKDIMEGYISCFYTYLLVTGFFVFSASAFACLPAVVVLLAATGYLFIKIPGNGRLSFVLFAFSMLQLVAYAYLSPNPHSIFTILAAAYLVGIPAIGVGGALIGYFFKSRYAQIDARHQNWIRSKSNDVTYGFKTNEWIIKQSYILNYNSPIQFIPRNLSGSMIIYAAWSTFIGILTWLLLYPTL